MAALITSKEVETIVRSALAQEGYKTSLERGYGETGTDARAKDFYEVFFRAVSRLDDGVTACVIALPSRFGMGLPQRARAIGRAWRRIGEAFPELKISLVDKSDGSIVRTEWNSWEKR
jgi:hypothetical protein